MRFDHISAENTTIFCGDNESEQSGAGRSAAAISATIEDVLKYRSDWQMETIPFDVLKKEYLKRGKARRGRPLKPGERCPCGLYLLKTALVRRHKCEAQ